MKALVINLPHRVDRWEKMQKDWKGILDLTRIDGVKSRKKYAGCAQAHINAILHGFKDSSTEYCLVLEDDVMPDSMTRDTLSSFIEATRHLFTALDGISMCPTFDRDVLSNDFFYTADAPMLVINPNTLVSGTAFMIYTRRIVSKLTEYQRHLTRYPWIIPNDRLFTTDSYGFFSFQPLTVGIPLQYECKLSTLALLSDNFLGGMDVSHAKLQQLVKQSKVSNTPFHSNITFRISLKTHVLLGVYFCLYLLTLLFFYGLNRIL
jgi:GR25 family glycosyltransferase involved in LPS biosynthesis